MKADIDSWGSPEDLLDAIEELLFRISPDQAAAEQSYEAEIAFAAAGLIPELRQGLRNAGVDIAPDGPGTPLRETYDAEKRAANAAAQAAAADARDARETALYRWWDADDILLYAGIADHIGVRTKDHAKGSSWMDFAVRSAVERHPRRSIALAAEKTAIKAEHPIFNHQHNDTPEAKRRQVEYLIAHNRLDLLAPAVSRA